MAQPTRWLARLGAAATALLTLLLLPAAAWAQGSSGLDLAGGYPRSTGLAGLLIALAGLLAITATGLALVLVARRRQPR